MAIRAQWGLESIDVAIGDPFTERQMTLAGPDVEEVGKPIVLTGDAAELSARLVQLGEREQVLFEQGLECPVKDRSDTSCSACPVQGRHGALCALGVEEEQLATRIALLQADDA